MAALIRSTYISARSAWECLRRGTTVPYVYPRGYDKPTRPPMVDGVAVEGGVVKPPIWMRLAREFAKRSLDPEEYLHRMFERSVKSHPPDPTQLFDKKFLEEYAKVQGNEAEEVDNSLAIQKHIAATNVSYWQQAGMDFVQSHSYVLSNTNLDLSALFRLCVAYSLIEKDDVFASIVKEFKWQAAIQFQTSRAEYESSWGAFIPAEFVSRSRRLYEKAVQRDDVTGGDWDAEEDDEEG